MLTTGERIKRLRTELGMSQEELGKKIGVQNAAVYKYEKGLVVNLKRTTIAALANALNTSPAYLMVLTDDPTPDPIIGEVIVSDTDPQIDELTGICAGMTADGIQRVIEYANDLSENPKYQKKNVPKLDTRKRE